VVHPGVRTGEEEALVPVLAPSDDPRRIASRTAYLYDLSGTLVLTDPVTLDGDPVADVRLHRFHLPQIVLGQSWHKGEEVGAPRQRRERVSARGFGCTSRPYPGPGSGVGEGDGSSSLKQ